VAPIKLIRSAGERAEPPWRASGSFPKCRTECACRLVAQFIRKPIERFGRYLVVEILATARDFQVRFGDFDSLLRSPFRSLLFARKSPLLSLQIIQRVLEDE
jgi:hypothetical protein